MIDDLTMRIFIQMVLAAVLGIGIGLEREHRRKAAGVRTHALVCMGAALFTILSIDGFRALAPEVGYDPSRIASQVVTGIGFIGAGLIFLQGDKVQGLTTAAGVWAAAAIGMAVGVQMYAVAVMAAALALVITWLFRFIEKFVPRVDDAEGSSDGA